MRTRNQGTSLASDDAAEENPEALLRVKSSKRKNGDEEEVKAPSVNAARRPATTTFDSSAKLLSELLELDVDEGLALEASEAFAAEAFDSVVETLKNFNDSDLVSGVIRNGLLKRLRRELSIPVTERQTYSLPRPNEFSSSGPSSSQTALKLSSAIPCYDQESPPSTYLKRIETIFSENDRPIAGRAVLLAHAKKDIQLLSVQVESWDELQQQLLRDYQHLDERDPREEIIEVRINENEKPKAFINRFRNLVQQLDDPNNGVNLAWCAASFLTAVPEQARRALENRLATLKKPFPLQELYNAFAPMNLNRKNLDARSSDRQLASEQHSGSQRNTFNNRKFGRGNDHRYRQVSLNSSSAIAPILPQGVTHTTQKATELPVNTNPTNNKPNSIAPMNTIVCFICKQPGHKSNVCPNRKGTSNSVAAMSLKGELLETHTPSSTLSINIGGQKILAVIDSGATCSTISRDCFAKLGLPLSSNLSGLKVALADEGKEATIDGEVVLQIEQPTLCQHRFFVGPFRYDMLLGEDSFSKLGIKLIIPGPTSTLIEHDTTRVNRLEDDKFSKEVVSSVEDLLTANRNLPTAFCSSPHAVIPLVLKEGASLPRKVKARPVPKAHEEELNLYWDKLLREGKIRPSSPQDDWESQITLVRKSNGKIRPCVDVRFLNDQLRDDNYPMPDLAHLLSVAKKGHVFSSLDLESAYLQFMVRPQDEHLLGFVTFHHGKRVKYVFTGCPFGVKVIPNGFQRAMNAIFQDLEFVIPFLDDLLVVSASVAEHVIHLRQVIERLNHINLRLNIEKSKLGFVTLRTLGHLISAGKTSADPKKIEAVVNWPTPDSNVKHLSYLGFINFLRAYIPECSKLTAALDVAKEQGFSSPAYLEAFHHLQQAVAHSVELMTPDFSQPFLLRTDASSLAIGATLSQEDRLVAVASRKLLPYERNYSAWKAECLALVFGLLEFEDYLLGQKFTIEVDNKALSFLQTSEHLPRVCQSWLDLIQKFNFDIKHIPGVDNGAADLLSRFSVSSLATPIPQTDEEKKNLILKVHDMGHLSRDLVARELVHRYGINWPKMNHFIQNVIKYCPKCLRHTIHKYGYHPGTINQVTRPWDYLQVDLALSLAASEEEKALLVIVDVFSNFVVLRALPNKKPESILKEFDSLFSDIGIPKLIQSDPGTEINNAKMKKYFEQMNITYRTSAARGHESQGIVENTIKNITLMIRKLLDGNIFNWPAILPTVQRYYNHRISSTSRSSPAELLWGRKSVLINEAALTLKSPNAEDEKNWATEIEYKLKSFDHLKEIIEEKREQGLKQSRKHKFVRTPFPVGTQVLKKTLDLERKNRPRWIGPYSITDINSAGYKLKDAMGTELPNRVPPNLLKLYYQTTTDDNTRYAVEAILDHRLIDGVTHYLTKWEGYEEPTWNAEDMFDGETLKEKYWTHVKKKTTQKKKKKKKIIIKIKI